MPIAYMTNYLHPIQLSNLISTWNFYVYSFDKHFYPTYVYENLYFQIFLNLDLN